MAVLRDGRMPAEAEPGSHEVLLTLLDRLRLIGLVGPHIAGAPDWFGERVERARTQTASHAVLQELVLLQVLAVLERQGITAAPVKGVTLAVAAHADPAARPSGDIDLLLARDDLPRAAAAVMEMGWGRPTDAVDGAGTPLLHLALPGPDGLPTVELHWRMHWWETDFAAAALARAAPAAPGTPGARLTPADHLAVVLMAYARDGLMGLRQPADVAALLRRFPQAVELDPDLLRGPLGPALGAAALAVERSVGTRVASQLGVEADSRRTRVALALADPFLRGSDRQIWADVSLSDLVLAPAGSWRAAARRQLVPPTAELKRRRPEIRVRGKAGVATARAEHAVRLLRRYGLAGGRVASAILRLRTEDRRNARGPLTRRR